MRQLPGVLLLLLLGWCQSPGRYVKIRQVLLLLLLLLLRGAEYEMLRVGHRGGGLVALQDSHHGGLLGEGRLEALDDGVHLAEAALNSHNGGEEIGSEVQNKTSVTYSKIQQCQLEMTSLVFELEEDVKDGGMDKMRCSTA